MKVSQWNLTREGSPVSGLRRYDDEIYKECSKYVDVTRCRSTGNRIKTLAGMKQGDVTHITTHQLAFLKSLKWARNCIVTVHDIIQHNWFSLSRKISDKWILNEFLLNRADMFIADSNYTKYDLMRCFKIDEDKIHTVYLGVDHTVFKPLDREKCRNYFEMNENTEYLLSVSSGEPWKNTELLKKLPYNIIDIGYGRGKYGTTDDRTLAMLYNACDIYLAPSKAEGFGLPVLEAMACGCPVIASNCTSFPEVVGNGGKLVNPGDPKEWIESIETVLGSSIYAKKRAVHQASKFSWEKCGAETCKVYKSMC